MEKLKGKKPSIRFPEFKDDWQHTKLSELLSEAKKRNEDLKYGKDEVLSVSGELGIVNQIEHLGRSYAGASVHNYHVVETGDIVYTKSPLKANPFGIIKLNKGKAGIVSTLYAVYKVNNKTCFGPWLDYYFSLDANTNRYLRPLVKKGAKNDMKINNAYVLHDRIFAPSIPEQKRIASFFTVLDKKIAELKQKKALLEQYKKGLMQKLFSQQLRFKDENGKEFPKWNKTTLEKISQRVTNKNIENNQNVMTISAQEGLISQLEFFNNSVSSNNLTGYYLLKTDDFAYNRSSSNGYPIGAIKRLKRYDKGVVSTLYICFKFKNKIDSNFFEHYFESGKCNREIEVHVKEGARNHGLLNIGLTDFFGISIYEPCEKEKIRITEFMNSLENKLDSCNSQLKNMIEYKRGLIQKMYCV
jgi:type I restriction enzyme S subunit